MGRHGAGPSATQRARVSVPLVAIAILVIAAIGFGIWLWSVRSVIDPIDAQPVDAYAVVVSSPSCTSGSGSTVIDLALTPAVRSSFSACGRRVGERVAVQYLSGHTDQVRLAGTTIAKNNSLGRWLPIAILAAGLLAVVATIALMIDRRKSRHAGAATRVTVAQLRAGAGAATPTPATPAPSAPTPAAGVMPPEPSGPPMASGPEQTSNGEVPRLADVDDEQPEVTTRIAMPGMTPHPFRPSEISTEEDLFTHRGPEGPTG